VHANSQHTDYCRRQSVVETESTALLVFHVERDRLQSAHVEQRLVLNLAKARMMQEVTEHETSLLACHRKALRKLLCRRCW
jgi:hypothetical protein